MDMAEIVVRTKKIATKNVVTGNVLDQPHPDHLQLLTRAQIRAQQVGVVKAMDMGL